MKRHAAVVALACAFSLAGCSVPEQLSRIGKAPDLSPIDYPVQEPGYRPVSLPMPEPEPVQSAGANSLWRSGARSFFRDQRARRVGDVLTVQEAQPRVWAACAMGWPIARHAIGGARAAAGLLTR